MRKQDAIDSLGGRIKCADAIGITPQAVSDWPDPLTAKIADRVVAAQLRMKPARRRSRTPSEAEITKE